VSGKLLTDHRVSPENIKKNDKGCNPYKIWLPIIDKFRTNIEEVNKTLQQPRYCFG